SVCARVCVYLGGALTVSVCVGHEPLPPIMGTNLFGHKVLYLPGFFTYAWHIVQIDGKKGLFRGLTPRILSNSITTIIHSKAKQVSRNLLSYFSSLCLLLLYNHEVHMSHKPIHLLASHLLPILIRVPLRSILSITLAQFVAFSSHDTIKRGKGVGHWSFTSWLFVGYCCAKIGSLICLKIQLS
uniref:Uncharacterized protein n=1 Tax=Callorhinchus milii TaxID=7868 RepID=A0A4W3GH65_CALMI